MKVKIKSSENDVAKYDAILDAMFGDFVNSDVMYQEQIVDVEQIAKLLPRILRSLMWLLDEKVETVDELNDLCIAMGVWKGYEEIKPPDVFGRPQK